MYTISVTLEKYARLPKCTHLAADLSRLQTMQADYAIMA